MKIDRKNFQMNRFIGWVGCVSVWYAVLTEFHDFKSQTLVMKFELLTQIALLLSCVNFFLSIWFDGSGCFLRNYRF